MRWHTADFESLSWRDVHAHGFRIVDNNDGTAELQFDLDFILERESTGVRVAQAILQFHDVFGLRFSLDYVVCSAGMSAFSIDAVTREPLRPVDDTSETPEEDHGPWRWRIDIGWPEGMIEFEASGFSQWLVGDEIEQEGYALDASIRL